MIDFAMSTPEALEKAKLIKEAGFWFEIEMLTTGGIFATITDDNDDWALGIYYNGPGLEDDLNKMIIDFNIDRAKTASNARTAEALNAVEEE
jgi:hypothetical protein